MKTSINRYGISCLPKPVLEERPLLTSQQSTTLTAIFKILANETRLRLLHALVKAGELCVSDLAEVMNMKIQAVSNQLQILTGRGIIVSRRNGNNIYYRILDPCVISLLDHGLCLSEDTVEKIK
jgi:ArsR family transcriptional regulator, lead/cadmium/zinc/bismuth-responsive transcriptional repressor